MERERARKREQEFKKVTENLHHLVSTKTTPGIYNNPYFENKRPKVRGRSVEEHLKEAFKKRGKKKFMKKKYTEPQVLDRRSIRISTTYALRPEPWVCDIPSCVRTWSFVCVRF